MPPKLFLCRHGQTDWNAEGRLQGQNDVPLNDLGRSQAKRNGRRLKEVLAGESDGFDFVSSPLSRAIDTMLIIRAEVNLQADGFRIEPRLIELSFGDWQGSTLGEIEERDPQGVSRRKADKWNFVPPGKGAESYDMLARRVVPVFEELTRPTVVVAHGGVTRSFLRHYGGQSDEAAAKAGIAQDRILSCDTQDGQRTIQWL